jgi:hypothetical protein
MLMWAWYGYHKKCAGTRYVDLVLFHLVRFVGHVLLICASWTRNVDTLFFTLGRAQCGVHKWPARTHYDELVFLHLVRSVGHVLCSGASTLQNLDALFFMLGWA